MKYLSSGSGVVQLLVLPALVVLSSASFCLNDERKGGGGENNYSFERAQQGEKVSHLLDSESSSLKVATATTSEPKQTDWEKEKEGENSFYYQNNRVEFTVDSFGANEFDWNSKKVRKLSVRSLQNVLVSPEAHATASQSQTSHKQQSQTQQTQQTHRSSSSNKQNVETSEKSLPASHVDERTIALNSGPTTNSSSCPPSSESSPGANSNGAEQSRSPPAGHYDDWPAPGSSPVGSFFAQHQKSSAGYTQTRASHFVKPNFYTLRLKLDPQKRKFGGQLMISVDLFSSNYDAGPTSATLNQSLNANGGTQINRNNGSGNSNNNNNNSQTTNSLSSTRYLTLHTGANIIIKKAFYVFTSRNNIQIPATRLGRNLTSELLTLDFHPNAIPMPSSGLLLLVYSGQVNDTESHGLFLHKSASAHSRATAAAAAAAAPAATTTTTSLFAAGLATHMEPSFARRLFPSWDEPHLKARFSLIVVLPFRGYEIISNTLVKRKSISLSCSGEPLQEVEFHTTPLMSTYLLTLVIGKFEHIESITLNNCKVRAYFYSNQTQEQASASLAVQSAADDDDAAEHIKIASARVNNQTVAADAAEAAAAAAPATATTTTVNVNQRRRAAQMALEFAVRTFDFLESALGVKYPLAKFDMIALRDFNSGGMENWGAAIFHENYLLCDNNNQNVNIRVNGGSNRPKRLVVPLVVAHEIAHQWFGNLITSRTWTYLWLNEGFAQLLMYEIAQALLPDEAYWHIFLEDNRKSAMTEDELITSARALELQPESDELGFDQEQQLDLFDSLTYNKGALVLRMVQFAMGPREFYAGLRHYLLKHSYGSVSSRDLWTALEESAATVGRGLQDRQLESIMSRWLKLEGFPLLSVRVFELPDQAGQYKLEFVQERFTLLPASASLQATTNSSVNNQEKQHQQQQQNSTWADWLWSIPVAISSERRPEPNEADLRLWPLATPTSGNSQRLAPVVARRSIYGAEPEPVRAPGSASLLISERAGTLVLAKASLGNWFKLNHQALGYFRVNYELDLTGSNSGAGAANQIDMLARMVPAIRDHSMAPIDRYNVIEDFFSMVLSGRKSLVSYLRFLQDAYDQEQETLVLRFIFDSLDRIKSALVSNSRQRLEPSWFDSYVRRFVRKLTGAFKARHQKNTGERLTPFENEAGAPMSHRELFSSFGSAGRLQVNAAAAQEQQRRRRALTHVADVGEESHAHQRDNQRTRQQQQQRQKLKRHRLTRKSEPTSSGSSSSSSESKAANLVELLELFDSIRLSYNDEQLARWASDLFANHFRSSSASSTQAPKSPLLESVGRELRASIYSAALNYKQQQQQQRVDSLSGNSNSNSKQPTRRTSNAFRDYVTSQAGKVKLLEATWHRMRQTTPSGPNNNRTHGESGGGGGGSGVFFKLLLAYETPDTSSSERAAIAQALGSARDLSKQIFLLNLTLASASNSASPFKSQDAAALLEWLARSHDGRQLIWMALNERAELFRQRQLFSATLKSVSRGLIEPTATTTTETGETAETKAELSIEDQLKQLYVIYGASEQGTHIGHSIEWVRINSLWFKRDHDLLAEYLAASYATPPNGGSSTSTSNNNNNNNNNNSASGD